MPVQRTPWNRSFDTPGPAREASSTAPDDAPGTAAPVVAAPLTQAPARTASPQVAPRVASAQPMPDRRSRAGAAWVGIAVGVALMVLLVVFLLQNTDPVQVAFLGMQGTAPLAVALLIAGVGFAVVTLVAGTTRIGQLRRRVNAGDRARRAASTPAPRA